MKKLLAILLALAMVFSMAACTSGGGETEPAEPAEGGEGTISMTTANLGDESLTITGGDAWAHHPQSSGRGRAQGIGRGSDRFAG